MSPRSFRKVFRYGVPGKGGIKEASAKPFHVVPAVRPALSSGRLLRSRFVRDSVADRPLRPGRRNGVRRRSQHMSFARESALTAGEQVILVQLSHALLRTDSRRPTAQRCMFQLLSLQQPIPRLCTSTGLVTSHLFFCVARRYVRGG